MKVISQKFIDKNYEYAHKYPITIPAGWPTTQNVIQNKKFPTFPPRTFLYLS